MPMSRRTTSSSNLRPMSRLTANSVFCGLVTAWRLADWPTSTSSSLVKATIEGVVRSPSLFSITRGLPPSMIATHELVVPRSMPITLLMRAAPKYSRPCSPKLGLLGQVSRPPGARRSLRDDDPSRPQQPAIELVPRLDHLQHRVWRRLRRLLHQHGLVLMGVERLPRRIELPDPGLLKSALQQFERRFLTGRKRGGIGIRGALARQSQTVVYCEQLGREAL